MRRTLPPLLIFVFVAAIYLTGSLTPMERALSDLRFRMLKRPASGDIVVVEIDAKSLQELNVWPWPRTYHARLLDNLREAGARTVALDIDFSARSTETADRALGKSLERMHGRTVLPVFRQFASSNPTDGELVAASPLPEFRRHTRLAHVNIEIESDSLVRRYLGGSLWDGRLVPSLGATIAGDAGRSGSSAFQIDFAIDPATLPRISYADALRGSFDRAQVGGRNVIVGATALELGDQLPVPVHQVIASPLLHALAGESLFQGRALVREDALSTLLVTLLLTFGAGLFLHRWSWKKGLAAVALFGGMSFAVSVAVQARFPVMLNIVPWALTVVLVYCYGVLRTIDRIEAQKQAIQEQILANRSRTQFLANVSHELRTPLNAIIGFSHIMNSETHGPIHVPEYRKYLTEIHRSGKHLLNMINDILDMSKIDVGKLVLRDTELDLGATIESCLTLVRTRADEGSVTLSSATPDDIPHVIADERLVKQMLLNLLSNAVKFTPRGGSVTLSLRSTVEWPLMIDVVDTGIGIAAEDLERAFEPFGQVDSSLQREYEGTGLGLPLVKAMIEAHGGKLILETAPGTGTTASLAFPAERIQPDLAAPARDDDALVA